jgi:hypothetical protein
MLRALAVLLLLLPLPAPAETLSRTWTPRTEAQADALRTGLALRALRQDLRNGGTVRQWGRDNLAALRQSGSANWGVIHQRGNDHTATLDQSGSGNAHVILQAGRGAEAHVAQRGGEVGVTVQLGY